MNALILYYDMDVKAINLFDVASVRAVSSVTVSKVIMAVLENMES